jgi:hypothetical protein
LRKINNFKIEVIEKKTSGLSRWFFCMGKRGKLLNPALSGKHILIRI